MNSTNKEQFLTSVTYLAESVYDFHERWSDLATSYENFAKAMAIRLPLIREEVVELWEEVSAAKINPEKLCLEAADVLYVALGSMVKLGIAGEQASYKVANKNNAKTKQTHFVNTNGKVSRKKSG